MMHTEKFSEPDSVFSSDSSLSACGGFWQGTYFHAKFPAYFRDKKFHITALEVIAIIVCFEVAGQVF